MVGTCPIQEQAPNIDYNEIIRHFLDFKFLGTMQGHQSTQQYILENSGLINEPELLIEMEKIFDEVMKKKDKQKARVTNGRR
jgi:hypothetical protein